MESKQLKMLWSLAFGDPPEVIEGFFSTAFAPNRCHFLEEDGQTVAALYWLDCILENRKYAYIYAVATHPDHRGRGLCRRLMEQAHRILKDRNYSAALLMPAEPELRQMYRKFGYTDCTAHTLLTCAAADRGVEVFPVPTREYEALRRRYLPEGGLEQPGESIEYLATYAQLYAGRDFVLAAIHQENSLFGLELLGNAARAPEILKAMGYASGTFRTPGPDVPFAMLCPLRDDTLRPTYLGFAFE